MITEAIVLAGGLGTRLRSAVPDLPKCMAPVAGRPFVSHIIDQFQTRNIQRFIFSLGYKHEVVSNFLQLKYSGLDHINVIEDEPLGTGGAIHLAIQKATTPDILVLNGDTFFDIDISAVASFHQSHGAECTLSLKPMAESDRYGVVEIDSENRIISFREKNQYQNSLINGGVYLLNKALFLRHSFPEKFSFEKDYLEKYYASEHIFGCIQDSYFIDIGIPEDYDKANIDFSESARGSRL